MKLGAAQRRQGVGAILLPQTLEMSMYMVMASVSLFLQEIFIQENKHNISSSLLQYLYKRSFFKGCGNIISKKFSECSV